MVAVTENFASVDVDVFNFELFYVLSTLVAVFIIIIILGGLNYCVLTFKLIIWHNSLIVYMYVFTLYLYF